MARMARQQPPGAPAAEGVEPIDHQAALGAQHALGFAQHGVGILDQLEGMGQHDGVDGIRGKGQRGERCAQGGARAAFGGHQARVLRARALEQVPRGAPGAHLQQLEAEHIIERGARQGLLLAQHAGPQRGGEPVAQSQAGVDPFRRCFQPRAPR